MCRSLSRISKASTSNTN